MQRLITYSEKVVHLSTACALHIYECLKRNKALPDIQAVGMAVLDGHESHTGYRRHRSECLERTIQTDQGDRIQYYHRQVTLLLLPDAAPGRLPLRLLLDHEPQREARMGSPRQCACWAV